MTLINRRAFLAGLSGLTFYNLFAFPSGKSPHDAKHKQKMEPYDMALRPHHIIDIIINHGKGREFRKTAVGHSQYIVAPKLLSNLDLKIKLVLEADDICTGCKYLLSDGKCTNTLGQISMQAYNDVLDWLLFDYLSVEVNSVMTSRKFLEVVNEKVPGIEKVCTHPEANLEKRLTGLIDGLIKLGIRGKNETS